MNFGHAIGNKFSFRALWASLIYLSPRWTARCLPKNVGLLTVVFTDAIEPKIKSFFPSSIRFQWGVVEIISYDNQLRETKKRFYHETLLHFVDSFIRSGAYFVVDLAIELHLYYECPAKTLHNPSFPARVTVVHHFFLLLCLFSEKEQKKTFN